MQHSRKVRKTESNLRYKDLELTEIEIHLQQQHNRKVKKAESNSRYRDLESTEIDTHLQQQPNTRRQLSQCSHIVFRLPSTNLWLPRHVFQDVVFPLEEFRHFGKPEEN